MRTNKSNRLKSLYGYYKWAIWLAIGLTLFVIDQWLALTVLLITTFNIKKKSIIKTAFDLSGVILVLMLVFFLLISSFTDNMNLPTCICLCITSVIVYYNGFSFAISRKSSDIFILFTLIALLIALPHILITVYDISQNGLINEGRRLMVLDEDSQQDTTLRVIFLSLSMIGISYFFWLKEKEILSKKYVYILAIFSILSLLCCLHYLSRTGLALFFLPLAMSFLWPKRGFSSSTAVLIVLFAVIIYYFLSSELFGDLFTLYEAREKDYSSMSNFGGRDEKWLAAWEFIKAHPEGATNDIYAHNMWLDFGKDGGIICFFLFVIFSLFNYVNVFKIALDKYAAGVIKFTIAVFSAQLLLSCFTECIHEGARNYLYVYFLICGCINGYYRKIKVLGPHLAEVDNSL